jgi:ABC-type antimicrobial peptide transport system permease subunit
LPTQRYGLRWLQTKGVLRARTVALPLRSAEMFFTYLRRELRGRMRQAVFIVLGLALGVGLVITVTSAATGVKNAQGTVLHALYGVGTDATVTKTPTAGSFTPGSFGFTFRTGTTKRPAAGTKINDSTLSEGATLASMPSSSVSTVAGLQDVAAAAGGLTLTDRTISGTVPAINFNGGGGGGGGGGGPFGGGGSGSGSSGFQQFRSAFNSNSFTVEGVDLSAGELGPLSTGQLSSGRAFTSADASSDVAMLDSSYATQYKLKVGSTIAIGDSSGTTTNFKVIGVVSQPAGDNPSDVYIPLAVAQKLANMKNDVNTIYVAANSSSNIPAVQGEIKKALPSDTVTTSSDLASEVTGSLSSASSLANNLGKWLAIAVLIAAFLLASLLTLSAVSRRVREFGTLKAIGWRSRRIVGQVMGESVTLGIIGGIVGVGLGFVGAELVTKLSHTLSATVGQFTGSATPGGAREFGFPGGGAGGTGGGAFGGGGGGGFPGGGGSGSSAASREAANVANHTVAVHLSASPTAETILLAVLLAVAGGIIAGMFGGWRAARLRPADALSKVG